MFNVEFLHQIRAYEYRQILSHMHPHGATVLEVGGGTGYQAKCLSSDGFDVISIDVPDSLYADRQEYPVQGYDGRHFPCPDHSIDIVFSSNVLEHVKDLGQLHRESLRVLKPGGYCVHVMPSGVWRFWTNVAHYIELAQRLVLIVPRLLPRRVRLSALREIMHTVHEMMGIIRHYLVVPRHGENGNAVTEIYTFSTWYWRRHFRQMGYSIEVISPIGLFYTGHMVLGARLSMRLRHGLSGLLGSACVLYKVSPQ